VLGQIINRNRLLFTFLSPWICTRGGRMAIIGVRQERVLQMTAMDLGVSQEQIDQFCRRCKISRLPVFGSAVKGVLRSDSDIDLLVTFAPDADWTMFDHFTMEDELSRLFGREVDLISVRALEENPNPAYRREIVNSARQIYAA
jgi:predicted nucleotidyltransferase